MAVPGRTVTWAWRNAGAPYQKWLEALDASRLQLRQAVQRGDSAAAMLLDPLIVGRLTGQWEQPAAQPGGARFRTPPARWLIAAQSLLLLAAPALYVSAEGASVEQAARGRADDDASRLSHRLQIIRAAGAQCAARHPNAPGARLLEALTRAPTAWTVSLMYRVDGASCVGSTLCGSVPYDYDTRIAPVHEGLRWELTTILQTSVGPAPDPIVFAHAVRDEAATSSRIAVAMEAARANARVDGAPQVIRWRFTGVLAAGDARVPLDFTFTPDTDPNTYTAAQHLAQYQTAMLAFTRQYLAPLFGVDVSAAPVPEGLRVSP